MVKFRCSKIRKDHTGISPVIGTVLMVSITVLLAMATFWLILPMLNQDIDLEDEKFILDQQSTTEMGPDDWDTSFIIFKIKKDEAIPWNTVSFAVLDTDGTILTDATISYGDTDGDGNVQESDTVILHGMTGAYDGATLKMLYKGEPLVNAKISFNSI